MISQNLPKRIKWAERFIPRAKQPPAVSRAEIVKYRKFARAIVKSGTVVCGRTDDGYVTITRKDEPILFELLELMGFFEFHCTNTAKELVYFHQVTKYISSGWLLYLYGFICPKGEVEIHHLDHDKTNNHVLNLRYVTPEENKLCAMACSRGYYKGVVKGFGKIRGEVKTLVVKTYKATMKRWGFDGELLEDLERWARTTGDELTAWLKGQGSKLCWQFKEFLKNPDWLINIAKEPSGLRRDVGVLGM